MAPKQPSPPAVTADSPGQRLFAGVFGAFLGLALLKFGNPPVLEKLNQPPTNVYEFVLGCPWPIGWAFGLLFCVAVAGLLVAVRRMRLPHWTVFLPLAWLGWAALSMIGSVERQLSEATLKHFVAAIACFYLGYFALSGARKPAWFWGFILGGFFLVLASGWQQHFGGLAETQKYFFTYIYPEHPNVPPEYLKKMTSTRIFGTLFYPNTLAGALLLLGPVCFTLIWKAEEKFTQGARVFLLAVAAIGTLACLFWSGSKGGWLLMLLLGGIGLLRLRFSNRLKVTLVCVTLLLGLAGFTYKYAGFFKKGATSVVARFDYWESAGKIALANPLKGTGPGTFSVPYSAMKRPESEMARLAHNDYLEQASDSGLPAAVLYLAFIGIGMMKAWRVAGRSSVDFAVWLGLLGWALQGFIEFNLYIPALSWLAFALLGWLWGRERSAGMADL